MNRHFHPTPLRLVVNPPGLCPECEAWKYQELFDEHLAEVRSERDPIRQPGHEWASDRESRERLDAVAPLVPVMESTDAVRD